MSGHFADRLIAAIERSGSIAVVGLDPRVEQLPPAILEKHPGAAGTPAAAAAAIFDFNRGVIDAVSGRCCAVKPQIAFYEQYGWHGYAAYQETVRYAVMKGLLVIGDIKRGDIASTGDAYARAHLTGDAAADAVTVNAYMGRDAVQPFLNIPGRGCFALVKTSNPSSGDIQDLPTTGGSVAEALAGRIAEWGKSCLGTRGFSVLGAVVGATYPRHLAALRARMPEQFLLIPGYGEQGGTAADVKPGLLPNGLGAIVNSSRKIIFAFAGKLRPGDDWREPVRAALDAMNRELHAIR